MKINRLLIFLVPVGLLISSCSSGSTDTTTTVAKETETVNGYEIRPDAYLADANLAGANLAGANLNRADLSGAN